MLILDFKFGGRKPLMSNTITGNGNEDLRMSNGATSVLLTTLCLSGSRVAVTNHEKDFIVFLAERDQNVIGCGIVGFSVGEMPWDRERLKQDQEYMIKVIDLAIAGLGREVLSYDPPEEYLLPNLYHFRNLVEMMDQTQMMEQEIMEWYDDSEPNEPRNNGYPCCKKHQILLTGCGCIACNDE